jgi:hypothetical protein
MKAAKLTVRGKGRQLGAIGGLAVFRLEIVKAAKTAK